ncbi:hypothetical protein G7Y89_g9725 [Cudoniella acicularis]|uniref:Uncharacterized protein n=1 Tax=Cudoniella acicularis TaxID=354080 RepID=A0A8H4W1L6_9HELO|nr:hypothetical protein G7Y89_g9725 [Cudoniella acicularis]
MTCMSFDAKDKVKRYYPISPENVFTESFEVRLANESLSKHSACFVEANKGSDFQRGHTITRSSIDLRSQRHVHDSVLRSSANGSNIVSSILFPTTRDLPNDVRGYGQEHLSMALKAWVSSIWITNLERLNLTKDQSLCGGLELKAEDVKNVRNLAMYNKTLMDIELEVWVDDVLGRFGNVRSLTMVVPQHEDDDHGNLVFLDHSDVAEFPEYSTPLGFHPLFEEVFPDLRVEYNLWRSSEALWDSRPYSFTIQLSDTTDGLSNKTNAKARFSSAQAETPDTSRSQRVRVTVTAENYKSLEVFVPVLTTIAGLASMFCQARGINIEIKDWTVLPYW